MENFPYIDKRRKIIIWEMEVRLARDLSFALESAWGGWKDGSAIVYEIQDATARGSVGT